MTQEYRKVMIKEAYVSFEIAKLLKEKGFKEEVTNYYDSGGNFVESGYKFNYNFQTVEHSAPTHQMAMKWLREVYGLFISINLDYLDWSFQMFDIKNRNENMEPTCLSDSYACHKCYEDAVEAALKYSLENLI